MDSSHKLSWALGLLFGFLLLPASAGFSQVSPAEMASPRLKSAEQTYFAQLRAMSRAFQETKFPYELVLSRYAGLDPKEQEAADRRGLEFVPFRNRVVLKVSGNYNAAFNSSLLTQNQRAKGVFDEVIVPILKLIPKYFPSQPSFDGFGFEISYHVRSQDSGYDYEGKEILALVLDKAGLLTYLGARNDIQRQEVLNGSEI